MKTPQLPPIALLVIGFLVAIFGYQLVPEGEPANCPDPPACECAEVEGEPEGAE